MSLLRTPPKTIFLVDGLGAVLSAVLLGAVLPRFEAAFGIPRAVLAYLAFGAALLAAYSLSCHWWLPRRPAPFLGVLAGANLTYCGFTIGWILYSGTQLTQLGLAYFLGEALIVIGLAVVELRLATAPD